jgi:hypothetical protein
MSAEVLRSAQWVAIYSSTPRDGAYAKARFVLAVGSALPRVAATFATAVTDVGDFGWAAAQPVSPEALAFTLRVRTVSCGFVMRRLGNVTSTCLSLG